MKLDIDQYNELKKKLGQYFVDYSIRHGKNVVMRYVLGANNAPTVARANEIPCVDELMGIIINEF